MLVVSNFLSAAECVLHLGLNGNLNIGLVSIIPWLQLLVESFCVGPFVWVGQLSATQRSFTITSCFLGQIGRTVKQVAYLQFLLHALVGQLYSAQFILLSGVQESLAK